MNKEELVLEISKKAKVTQKEAAEVLSAFEKMPQVGDIATVIDKDKIRNHFISIEREINKRKYNNRKVWLIILRLLPYDMII